MVYYLVCFLRKSHAAKLNNLLKPAFEFSHVKSNLTRDLSNYRSTAGIIYELLLAKSGLGVI